MQCSSRGASTLRSAVATAGGAASFQGVGLGVPVDTLFDRLLTSSLMLQSLLMCSILLEDVVSHMLYLQPTARALPAGGAHSRHREGDRQAAHAVVRIRQVL